jgi:hypothetical protein
MMLIGRRGGRGIRGEVRWGIEGREEGGVVELGSACASATLVRFLKICIAVMRHTSSRLQETRPCSSKQLWMYWG